MGCKHTQSVEPVVITVAVLAQWLESSTAPQAAVAETVIGNIWMDSRKIEAGDIFLALEGELVDGHGYVETALNAGALVAIVAEEKLSTIPEDCRERCLVVADPLLAVQSAAAIYRRKLEIPVIAVTGSNGKTTTTQFIRELLSTTFKVGGTVGNWNNHIGVPLSVFRVDGSEEIVVFEMGANHEDEIRPLAEITDPDIGIITNIGYAHVGLFGSIETTTRTKFELADQIEKNGGLLLLNGDDGRSVAHNEERQIPAVYFGTGEESQLRAEAVTCDANGCYSFRFSGVDFTLTIPGYHFVLSVLPALGICRQMGIDAAVLQEAVAALKPQSMRGGVEVHDGVQWVVDCYNANPSSMEVSTTLLCDLPVDGARGVVAGDMGELEPYSEELHRESGAMFAKAGVQKLIAVGCYAQEMATGARDAGINADSVVAVATAAEAAPHIARLFKAGDALLLKGSRSVGLESLIPAEVASV